MSAIEPLVSMCEILALITSNIYKLNEHAALLCPCDETNKANHVLQVQKAIA